MRHVVLDTETTGLSPDAGDRVIEIGCVEMVDRRLTGRHLHVYLNPGNRSSHPDAVAIHGLTDAFLADKPAFEQVVDELLQFVAGAQIVIHNAAFDVGFLNAELKRVGRPLFHTHCASVVDTLLLARDLYPGKGNSLDALCRRLEVDNSSRTLHGALLDAGLLAEVYIRMTRGQNALVVHDDAGGVDDAALAPFDFTAYRLPVIAASDAECADHARVLAEIDKASRGQTIWRQTVDAPAARDDHSEAPSPAEHAA